MGKKKVVCDMALNIVSVAVPSCILQLLILPKISNYVSGNTYGLMITILALMNTIPSTFGNVLNNVRLLHRNNLNDPKGNDVTVLFFVVEAMNVVFLLIISMIYLGSLDVVGIVLTVLTGIVWLAADYHSVAYRLDLDYVGVFISNVLMSVGYCVGYSLFLINNRWQWIYIIGFLCFYLYLIAIKKSRIILEVPQRSASFSSCVKDTLFLSGANVLGRAVNYADKVLMYPIMGGEGVAIYFAATLLGKVVSMVITPVNSVALSYISRCTKRPDEIFKWTVIVGGIICAIGYFFAVVIGKPVLDYLYPSYADEAIKYIYITSASVVVQVFTSIITPFVIKFCNTTWQIVINLVTTIIYILVSLSLVTSLGITGFCIGVLIANIVKMIITIWTYYRRGLSEKDLATMG